MAVYVNSKRVPALVPSSVHMNMRSNAIHSLRATFVTTAWISVECGRGSTISVVLDKVEFCATTSTTRVAILADGTWKRHIEIVVDATMCTSQIHIELYKSTSQVEGCF